MMRSMPDLKRFEERVGLAPIVDAAYDGDVGLVLGLLKAGADPNSVDPSDNLTVLHIACLQGDEGLVDALLEWDRTSKSIDYEVRSTFRPRLAWQTAFTSGFYEIARKVDDRGLERRRERGVAPAPLAF